MPWPIPTMLEIEHPKALSWRVWLPTLVVIASSAVGAVLLLWPHDKLTNTATFWVLLIGAPLVAYCLVFGVALDRWESAKVQAEEKENEQDRLVALWRSWCQRHLRVAAAVAITPVPTVSFDDVTGDLPVNKDRAKGLEWKAVKAGDKRYGKVLSELAGSLKPAIENRREIAVTLLHGEISTEIIGFESELKGALEKAAPDVRFIMTCGPITECAPWIAKKVDERDATVRLIVATQIWPEADSPHEFSEGVAAILLEPREPVNAGTHASGSSAPSDGAHTSRILRPMPSVTDNLEAEIAQMVQMQTAPQQPTHLWHTGCDAELSAAIQSAIESDPKHPLVERSFDHAVGLPGPATGWIMLATALEGAPAGSGPQLLAWRDAATQQLHLCMIAPPARKQDSEGARSEG
ncbi:hypothetical protein AWB77_02280 [Caballeronia fortuita]|uniref:Transmembrane protein n=1 Tax=Caballeronia fortuita TaxID=1777138 RepID=A0A158AZV7_9BURK|nr:hypothetical protein [Caballeronia fortuita]SAK63518.1 hypothetical protein AWB77_02280 [Caballeronia fortuita]